MSETLLKRQQNYLVRFNLFRHISVNANLFISKLSDIIEYDWKGIPFIDWYKHQKNQSEKKHGTIWACLTMQISKVKYVSLEAGKSNATILSLYKVSLTLMVPLIDLFEKDTSELRFFNAVQNIVLWLQ